MEINDTVQIHSYKHNGKIHRIWEKCKIIENNENYIICSNYKTKVIEHDGKSHRTKEPALVFFYKDNWYNIVAQFKEYGIFYYCNIASPYVYDENTIKYIDYDLDLRVFPDGTYRILDKNEYKYHKKLMKYSDDLDLVLKKELEKLINMKNKNEGPFDKNYLMHYFEKI